MIALLITLILTLTNDGLQIMVSSDVPTHVYIQVDNASPAIRVCELQAGEGCGFTALGGLGSAHVRVWTNSGEAPAADQTIILPAPHTVYLPLL